MIRSSVLRELYDKQIRPTEAAHLPPLVYAETDGPIDRIVGQHRGLISAPPDLRLGTTALDALIVRQRDFFAARNEAVEWKIRGHDKPSNIEERLIAAGFIAEEPGTLMIGMTDDLARHDARLPVSVTLRRTFDESDMHRIASMESRVWDDDLAWLARDLILWLRGGPQQIAVFVVETADEVVSAAWLVCKPIAGVGGLWGGSTLVDWRRQGIYRALVARRAQLAQESDVHYLQVDASVKSRPILEQLGFVAITTAINYVWTKEPGAPR